MLARHAKRPQNPPALPPLPLPPPRRTECGNLRAASVRVVVLLEQEPIGHHAATIANRLRQRPVRASGVGAVPMTTRMTDHVRALEPAIVARCDAEMVIGMIVDRCDVAIGHRCAMATVANVRECVATIGASAAREAHQIGVTLAAVAEIVAMIVARDAKEVEEANAVETCGVGPRRKIVGELLVVVVVLGLEANPVATGETLARRSRPSRGRNVVVVARNGPRKPVLPPARMRTAGRT
uniref:(northern house mosquito) hypothetical protein n=2 Tax=Culex pipiens TaxID=7175 RepID=A0A8D8JJP1_CULPI